MMNCVQILLAISTCAATTGRTSAAGSGGCSDCSVGTFGAAAVNPTCEKCPADTFGDEIKMAACKVGWHKLQPVLKPSGGPDFRYFSALR